MPDPLGSAHLAYVDPAFEAGLDLCERTEGGEVRDLAGNLLADLVVDENIIPRVGDEFLHRQVDALALEVHVEYFDANLVAYCNHFTQVVEAAVGEFTAVHE